MEYVWHDVVGNLGVLMILGTYLLVQIDRMDVRHIGYSFWNALGAGLILVSLVFEFNLSAFIMELVWLSISIYGLTRRMRTTAGQESAK